MKIVNRIKKSDDFGLTIHKGHCYSNSSFRVHIFKNSLSYVRVGISVSAKWANAVTRNRVRRQIRAMCDDLIDYDASSTDIVIIAKENFLNNSFQCNKSLICELIEKQIGIKK